MARILCAALLAMASLGAAPPLLDQLAWMAGSWSGEEDGVRMEEVWMEPEGGLMLGMHRDVASGKAIFFEYLRIESTPDGIVYTASPRGGKATSFKYNLEESRGRRVVFENPAHDFPKRILYWLDEGGSLHARIEGARGEDKKAREWSWRRALRKNAP